MLIPIPLQFAIDEFAKFPGIGRKTAQRLALHLLKCPQAEIDRFIAAVSGLKTELRLCTVCFNLATSDICEICASSKRDISIICVVEDIIDIIAVEKSNEYNGLYHVIGGTLSPLQGINPEDLRVKELLARLKDETVKEIILALNPDTEGETTALYLYRQLKDSNVKVTRIARGIPIGGDLEYSDEATIGRAVLGRVEL